MQSESFSSMFLRMKLQPSQSRPGLVTNATSSNNDKFLVADTGRDVYTKAQGTEVCTYVCMCV